MPPTWISGRASVSNGHRAKDDAVSAHDNHLQRTVMDEVPSHEGQRAAVEPERWVPGDHVVTNVGALILTILLGAVVDTTAVDAGAPVAIPRLLGTSAEPMYPSKAVRLNQQGRILVEFSISSRGRLVDARLIAAEPESLFGEELVAGLQSWRFAVPHDWESSGNTARRFRVSVIFVLKPCPESESCIDPEPYDSDLTVTVSRPPVPKPR
jgi:TonB family protein